MPDYRRAWHPGGTYFFTLNLLQRCHNNLLTRRIDVLRAAVRKVRVRYPFDVHAWLVLPDHWHCVVGLPDVDLDFAVRLRLIKTFFRNASRPGNGDLPCGCGAGNAACGSGAIGSIRFATRTTIGRMSVMCTLNW